MSASSSIVKLGAAGVVIPALGLVLGLALQAAIPGCHCDEGAGCVGCAGLDTLISTMTFGGLVSALFMAIVGLPICLLLALVVGIFSKRESPTAEDAPERVDRAVDRAIEQFRHGRTTSEVCPACNEPIYISASPSTLATGKTRLNLKCNCGKCSGEYELSMS